MRRFSLACSLALLASSVSAQTTWFVDDDGFGGDGTQADPFCSVQEGIDAAVSGDLVLVLPGTYFEPIDFSGKDIVLRALGGVAETILDGTSFFFSFEGSSFIVFENGEGRGAVLEGFTIRNCYSNAGGGAVNCDDSSPTILGNEFVNNESDSGGGAIACRNGANARILYNVIRQNTCGAGSGEGGGIRGSGSTLEIVGNVIEGNDAYGDPVGYGGGIFLWSCVATIEDNLIVENDASDWGDGYGGGVCLFSTMATLDGNTFARNRSTGGFLGPGSGGAIASFSSTVLVMNSILWGDLSVNGEEVYVNGGLLGIMSSNVEGGRPGGFVANGTFAWGDGNMEQDPLFMDPASGDYGLLPGSPMIDAGTASHPPGGLAVSAYPRILDGDGDGVARVDLGWEEASLVDLQLSALAVMGETVELTTLTPSANWNHITLVSLGTDDRDFGALGSLLLDLSQLLFFEQGVAPDPVSFLVPDDLALLGTPLYAQSLAIDLSGIPGSFSNRVRMLPLPAQP